MYNKNVAQTPAVTGIFFSGIFKAFLSFPIYFYFPSDFSVEMAGLRIYIEVFIL